ncbi:heme lyase CcmF/NrfE family subunit [Solidesulfovibrio sp.]|uniref:heme lyase CcmF/NrfE family subunit n=1 Tax=Solidesulfovibrio sp. TaxID=2910990 RepID=UPI002B21CC35|nr:cytochrome c biogenesis protein CcsA [Solidesulfovibrio sp.]MEA4855398.1 cytochrome c biogenesis protein CcsA [Solidesulfovibrio sp.]
MMYLAAHFALLLAMLVSLLGGALACLEAWSRQRRKLPWLERGQDAAAFLMACASAALLGGLLSRDFSLAYVADYSDSLLPLFYTVTAFWAGQAGSLLFWGLILALAGAIFSRTARYKALEPSTRILFWLFFLTLQGFFLVLLTGPSNPFVTLASPPADGKGLNPLLRNVGMIFHPPLLFIGYAGFAIPACLSLAATLSGEGRAWLEAARNWILGSWAFLTAGILLGGWWSYMELGWGGYWAWDPVENASLIPWFAATALVHTALLERRFGLLPRTNVCLACLTLILCLFATYLVRSGVVESLHAFGDGGVAGPLLVGVLFAACLTCLAAAVRPSGTASVLPGLASRPGLMVVSVWLLLALGLVVLLGTIWPLLSQLWAVNPKGAEQGFYNTVCLPLFTLLTAVMALAPWFGWTGGPRRLDVPTGLVILGLAVVAAGASLDVRPILAVAGIASAAMAGLSVLLLLFLAPGSLGSRRFWSSHGSHLGLAVIVLGVAVSGPFQRSVEKALSPGESFDFSGYRFTSEGFGATDTPGQEVTRTEEARITVSRGGKPVGLLTPQRLTYRNYDHPHTEVSTVPGLGDELYATVHDLDGERLMPLKVSVNPLVNWVWIGSILVCLLPLLAFRLNNGRTSPKGGAA